MRRYHLQLQDRQFTIDVQELSADCFAVQLDGQSFEVTLTGDEDLPDAHIAPGAAPPGRAQAVPAAAGSAPARSPAPRAAALPAAPGSPGPRAGAASTLGAPMPGVILELSVKPGDVVQRGQQVAVLDAMKMHNFIGAPRAGTIAEVCVSVGQAVGHGDAIVRYSEG